MTPVFQELLSGTGINEDMRQLKDFKALISEKTVPKSIKFLKRTMIVLIVSMITLTSVEISYKFKQNEEYKDGVIDTEEAFRRHDIMADINFKTRKLEVLSRDLITGLTAAEEEELELSLKEKLNMKIKSLQTIQFNVIKAAIKVKSDKLREKSYPIENLLNSGTTTEVSLYNDAIFQYITASSSIRNSSLDSFLSVSDLDSTKKNFFFVRRNGLVPLREGSEFQAGVFNDHYQELTHNYDLKFRIMMIVGLLVLFLSQLVLIPIVFSVHRTNNKVLSLFGYIPVNEINELASRCERFIQKYLEDYQDKRENSLDRGEHEIENSTRREHNENTYFEVNPNESINPENIKLNISEGEGLEAKVAQLHQEAINQAENNILSLQQPGLGTKSLEVKQEEEGKSLLKNNTQNKEINPKIRANLREEEKRNPEDEADAAIDRTQKLLNSKDNNRRGVIIQFTAVTILFIIWFIVNYIHTKSVLKKLRISMDHLQLIAERTPDVRYAIGFALEEIAENDLDKVYLYDGRPYVNFRQYYVKKVFDNDQRLFDSLETNLPGTFEKYIETFRSYNLGDVCESYFAVKEPSKKVDCQAVSDGLLEKGLRIAITTIIQNSEDTIKTFDASGKTSSDQESAINEDKFLQAGFLQEILETIAPALDQLKQEFIISFEGYITKTINLERLKFAMFVVGLVSVFLFVWIPYMRNLSNKIFRTKGMLNMIPMELISKNESLKNLFISGDLLQAVK